MPTNKQPPPHELNAAQDVSDKEDNPTSATDDDERVDAYVRNKMSEEQALAFEMEYIDNPELCEKVELAQALRDGLQHNTAQNINNTVTADNPNQSELQKTSKLWHYFAVPQTAWGALAASIILIPSLLYSPNNLHTTSNPAKHNETTIPKLDTAVFILEKNTLRGTDEQSHSEYTINIDGSISRFLLGIKTPSTLGVPYDYNIGLYNDQESLLWQGKQLTPDADLTIYIDINREFLPPGRYYYILTQHSTQETHQRVYFSLTKDTKTP